MNGQNNNEYKHHITLQHQSQLKCNKDDLFPFLSSSLLHPNQNSRSMCAVADVTMTYKASDSCWRAVHCLADCRNQWQFLRSPTDGEVVQSQVVQRPMTTPKQNPTSCILIWMHCSSICFYEIKTNVQQTLVRTRRLVIVFWNAAQWSLVGNWPAFQRYLLHSSPWWWKA